MYVRGYLQGSENGRVVTIAIFMPCFGSHFENGRHLENFENAELHL